MENKIKFVHEKAKALSKAYLKLEGELLEIIQQVEALRVYHHLGYPSLFKYVTSELGLSEASAYNFISVARKAREVPELKQEIANGTLTVATARKIVPVLNKENNQIWIAKAKDLPKLELERQVAGLAPETLTPERVQYVSSSRARVNLGLEKETVEKLKRAQELLAQLSGKNKTIEETMDALLDFFLSKKDPLKKAARKNSQIESKMDPVEFSQSIHSSGTSLGGLKRSIKHEVVRRALGQCQHNFNGRQCTERRYLHVHHVHSKSSGGGNELENLQLLCSYHHQAAHGRWRN